MKDESIDQWMDRIFQLENAVKDPQGDNVNITYQEASTENLEKRR